MFVSSASTMEISAKHRLGKLAEAELLAANLTQFLGEQGLVEKRPFASNEALFDTFGVNRVW